MHIVQCTFVTGDFSPDSRGIRINGNWLKERVDCNGFERVGQIRGEPL